jgi:hypothetical protein
MSVRFFLMIVVGLLVMSGIQAEVYRWVDERGKVHFSDQPNRGGAQKLEISGPKPDSTGIDQERLDAERKREQERLLDVYREEREERQLERDKAEQAERQRASNCAYARNQLRSYGNSRLYQPLEDGGRRYLDDDERQREIERAEASVQHWCDA